ncbi:MAG: NAD(P)-binding domain-containing protein [Pseudomonadota bacterium]
MRIGILGTGNVGQTLGRAFVANGHDVRLGGRQAGGDGASAWAAETGEKASEGNFADAAAFGEVVVLAAKGEVALDVVAAAGADALSGKLLIDLTNPLDFSGGFPPKLTEGLQNSTSLGEKVQAALPDTRVVKALNTIAVAVMVNPGALAEPTDIFMAGNDATAKEQVADLLAEFGWSGPVDLGGIEASRGLEAYLLLWTRAIGPMGGNGMFNIKLVRALPS